MMAARNVILLVMSETQFVDPNSVLPSQDFLKPGTIKHIFESINCGKLDELPPSPIVRTDGDGHLVAIDGHNLIAVKAFLAEDIEVHIASSGDDGIEASTEADAQRNTDLREKYDASVNAQERVSATGVKSFQDLISKYPDSFSEQVKF